MASLASRTAQTVSRSWPRAVPGIWASVGGPSTSRLWQLRSYSDEKRVLPTPEASSAAIALQFFRSYSDEEQDCRVPRSPEVSSAAADPLAETPLPGQFPWAVPKIETFFQKEKEIESFGVERPGCDRNAHPARRYKGFRVYHSNNAELARVDELPIANLEMEPQPTRTWLNGEERPVGNYMRASRNMAHDSCPASPRQGFVSGSELPKGSAHLRGNIHLRSASTTSEAIVILKHRQQQGMFIDLSMVVEILKRCSKQKDLTEASQVADFIVQSGMDEDPYVATTLLNIFIKCGRLQDARRVFNGLGKTNRNIIRWNMLIGAYAKSGCGVEAYRLFLQMKREGFVPNAITYMSILNTSASAGALEWVKEVHSHALEAGLDSDLRVGNALLHMYAKSGGIGEARTVFDRLERRDVISWTTMIGAYAESGCFVEAYRLFLQMKREGVTPNEITYMTILNLSGSAGSLAWVKEIHGHARRAGLESDLRVGGSLVRMYVKNDDIGEARVVFNRMKKRDVITWTIMIGAYADSGCGVEAYRLFLRMIHEGFIPDAITYTSILSASASAGELEWVKEVHDHARRAGLESDLRVGGALVHMYVKSGSIDAARLTFDILKKRDVVTFNIMIGGLAQHGRGHEALRLFEKLNMDCVQPDENLFVAVLSACSHAGLVDDGRRLLLAMKEDYGIEPTVVHYNCMVDLLGRAGQLEEAKLCIDDMPVEPNAVTWKSLLGACRTYGNVELGELAAKEALKLEPMDASPYVLLSNIYAAAGKWGKVSSVRTMMQERGVRKEPGLSWIEVDNKIHEFVVGDISHPESKAIYSVLKNLSEKLNAEGYVPETQRELQNIDEEDKELVFCCHSEKLAIAYGILRIPSEKPIRIFKNLRVCSDCHTATKFISKVTGREIIARDANRFHHFKDGVCSCDDYW